MAVKSWEESRKDTEAAVTWFIATFLDENASRCLDDEDDRAAVAKYLRENLPPFATDLTRAALGLKK